MTRERNWLASMLILMGGLSVLVLVSILQVLDNHQRLSFDRMPYLTIGAMAAAALSAAVWRYRRAVGGGRAVREAQRAVAGEVAFVTPLELPAPPDYLVGRDEEINSLAGRLSMRPGPAVVGISGPGGVGKTALAVAVARRVAGQYPDGQLFAQFTGYSVAAAPGTANASVLRDFVAALQRQKEEIPKKTDELVGRYHELSRGLKILVVLDDVPADISLTQFIPQGNECAIIVTCRERRGDLDPINECSLQPLSADAALSLLEDITGWDDRETLWRLAESCGRLPLALRLAGGALAQRPKLEFSVAVDRALGVTAGPESHPLDAIYAFLTSDERLAFRCLPALGDYVFAPWMLAAAAGVDEQVADTLANRLVYSGLVERHSLESSTGSLYVVPERVADYAQLRSGLEDDSQTRDARLARVGEARHSRHLDRIDRQVRSQVFPLMMEGSVATAMARARSALSLARELRDAEAENSARTVIAELTAELGNISESEEMLTHALFAAEPSTQARAYRNLGHCHRRLYRLEAAAGAFARARGLAQEAHDRGEEVRVIVEQAILAALLGEPATSDVRCGEAEHIVRRHRMPGNSQESLVLLTRGRTLSLVGDPDRAYPLLAEARDIAREKRQIMRGAHVLLRVAEVQLQQGLIDDAEQRATQALREFAEMRHHYGTARCRLLLGRIAFRGERYQDSVQILHEALEGLHGYGDPIIEAEALLSLSYSHYELGELGRAARVRDRSLEMFTELGYADGIVRARSEAGTSGSPAGGARAAASGRGRIAAAGR